MSRMTSSVRHPVERQGRAEHNESGAPRRLPRGSVPAIAALAAAVLCMLVSLPAVVVRLDGILPQAGTIRSAGTQFPAFADVVSATLRRTALVLVVGAGAALVVPLLPATPSWLPRAATGGVAVLAGALAAFTARPPNAFPSNARIHWVDNLFDRADNYFYALVKIPNRLFYEMPWVLAALLAMGTALLSAAIIRRAVPGRSWAAPMAAASVSASAITVLFANAAEDVALTVLVILCVAWAFLARAPLLLGLALFTASLARPQLLVLLLAVAATEGLAVAIEVPARRVRAVLDRLRGPSARRTAVGFTVPFVLWQTWLHLRGDAWFLTDGQVVSTRLQGLEPRPIDGFSITPFSGAYALHLLWLLPAALLLTHLLAATALRQLPSTGRRLLLLSWLFSGASILVSETLVLYYYNVRYLAYTLPLLLLASWTALESDVLRALPRPGVVAVAVVLAFSPAAFTQQGLEAHRRVAADPLGRAFSERGTLREVAADRPIATDLSGGTDLNYLVYLLRRPVDDVMRLEQPEIPAGAVLFTQDREDYPTARVVWEGDGLWALERSST